MRRRKPIDWNATTYIDPEKASEYGVAAWYPGWPTGGNTLYDLGPSKGHHGTLNGPTWTRGKFGEPALTFNRSSSQYVSGSHTFTSDAFTVAAWANIASYHPTGGDPNYQVNMMLELTGSVLFHEGVNGTQGFRAYFLSGTSAVGIIQSPTPPTLGAWYHVVYTYDGANVRLYENGVQVATTAVTGAVDNATAFLLGRSAYSGGSQYLSGSLAQPLVCNRALTAAQISELCRNPFLPYWQPSTVRTIWMGSEVAPGGFQAAWAAAALQGNRIIGGGIS